MIQGPHDLHLVRGNLLLSLPVASCLSGAKTRHDMTKIYNLSCFVFVNPLMDDGSFVSIKS